MLILALPVCTACGNKKERIEQKSNTINANIIKKDSLSSNLDPVLNKPPIINLVDTTMSRLYVLYKKDSSGFSTGISPKLKNIYDEELPKILEEKKLKAQSPGMAWFTSNEPPFYFEAGLYVDKQPEKLKPPFYSRTIAPGKAIIAHYYGPYGNTVMAYEVLNEWVKDNKKIKRGNPYEIYVTPPINEQGKALDPFRVRTDIILHYR